MNPVRPPAPSAPASLVVALGGNALWQDGDDGSVDTQFDRARQMLRPVAELIAGGTGVVLTHGNGPVVGGIVLRNEMARSALPPTPLFIADADSEGGIGLMLQQVLTESLADLSCRTPVATLVTQVVVDANDPAFLVPTKPIGPRMAPEEATRLAARHGWALGKPDPSGVRRVVSSPRPIEIVELEAIRALLEAGIVPIACGGGGVPVVEDHRGAYRGIDAVIDKDRTAALLADRTCADMLVILMEEPAIMSGWGTPEARPIRHLTASGADRLAVTLQAGTMRPKVEAAAWLAHRGRPTVICSGEHLREALAGASGTTVVPDA